MLETGMELYKYYCLRYPIPAKATFFSQDQYLTNDTRRPKQPETDMTYKPALLFYHLVG